MKDCPSATMKGEASYGKLELCNYGRLKISVARIYMNMYIYLSTYVSVLTDRSLNISFNPTCLLLEV